MIKYANIKGYEPLGECGLFSHVYQWIEKDHETPVVILIHAFEGKPTVFKGYLYIKTETFSNIPITENELNELESFVGKIEQKDFGEFIKNTVFREAFCRFTAVD